MPYQTLTEKQKAFLIWLVDHVRSGDLPDEEMLFSWTKDGVGIAGYTGEPVQVTRNTIETLSKADLLTTRDSPSRHSLVASLTGASYRAVDTGFATDPDRGRGAIKVEASEMDARKVFVVHGRDERLRSALFSFLRALGLHPIEWEEAIALTGTAAPYVGAVLDAAFSAAAAVVVLLTPDDLARLRIELLHDDDQQFERELTGQARPNVLFEAGMAMGRHPKRTVLLQVGNLRPFSDIVGRHVIKMDGSIKKRKAVSQRLRNAGCDVSIDGDDWLSEGDFSVSAIEDESLTPPVEELESKGGSDLSDNELNFLSLFSNTRQLTASSAAGLLGTSIERAELYLDRLTAKGLLQDSHAMGWPTSYRLSSKGREGLFSSGRI